MSIPNKSNFKFQELTPITGVKPYVLRYWETEFPEIAPITSEKGEKIYARKDIEAILKIKKLLFEDKLNIPEAKMKMSLNQVDLDESLSVPVMREEKSDIKNLLVDSLTLIKAIKAKRNW